MKLFTIALLVLSVIACKENSKEGSVPIEKKEVSEVKSKTYKMLQGTWINKVDTLSAIRFEGNTSTNSYNGVDSGKEIYFTIGGSCAAGQTVAPTQEDKYINTTGVAEECYYIETLDETNLTMKLVSVDVVLQFRRQ